MMTTADRIEAFRELRQQFLDDPHRPLWHVLCPEEGHAMPFDPNGAIFWKGRYHLFYIFQKKGDVHCWGHLSSIDLVHWRHHPTALDVAPDDPDRGIFSGNAFLDHNGVPTILYHGVAAGNAIAQATDPLLEHWTKLPTNPIVPIPKPGEPDHGVFESWDPHGWVEGNTYYAVFGGKKPALMKGPAITALTYQHGFIENDTLSDDEDDVSCPDFFPIGDRHALIAISHQKGIRWWTGRWADDHFVAECCDNITWPGGTYFAPETLLDPQGRRLLWGWAWDPRGAAPNGWSGVMSQPVQVTLADDGSLAFSPIPELACLRYNPSRYAPRALGHGDTWLLSETVGDSLELDLEATVGPDTRLIVSVRRSPDGTEHTDIVYDAAAGTLQIAFGQSGDPTIHHKGWVAHVPRDPAARDRRYSEQTAPFSLTPGEPLRLQVFIDRSIIEVFANQRRYLMQRVFPTRTDSTGVAITVEGGDAQVQRLDTWELDAAHAY